MTTRVIRIGTRSSQLALWQANTVSDKLNQIGYKTQIVTIDSVGDKVLNKPLYELGVTGVFTKNLDIALLNEEIDIAVHSCKDVPTKLPEGIVQAAVLERGNVLDVLVLKKDDAFIQNDTAIIATGSLRRRAQWLHRYPNHEITDLRGNVNTRLKKLKENNWDGAIFAKAGLERLNLLPDEHLVLDWMIPAPAQGAVVIAALEKDKEMGLICSEINDKNTALCVGIEREFLNVLEGGCTAPIGALARIVNNTHLHFQGVLHSPDGKDMLEYEHTVPLKESSSLGRIAALDVIERGGKSLMDSINKKGFESTIYSTRKLSDAQLKLFDRRLKVDMSNFISVSPNVLEPIVLEQVSDHVVFTSQNAVEALLHNFGKYEFNFENIYCVGERTKQLLENKVTNVTHVENSASELANYLVQNINGKTITFFCGNKRRNELPNTLIENHIDLREIECYKTVLTPVELKDDYSAVLFFSPSGVESFLKQNKAGNFAAFCIGKTTASIAAEHFEDVIVSEQATIESVIESVNTYFNKILKP